MVLSVDQSAARRMSETVTPDQAALELAAPRIECALNTPVSIPASCRQVLSHLAIVLLVTASRFPIQERNKLYQKLEFITAVLPTCMHGLWLLCTHLCHLGTWGKRNLSIT